MMHELGASTSHDDRLTDPLSVAAHAANAIETALVMDKLKKAGKTSGNTSCNKAGFDQTLSIKVPDTFSLLHVATTHSKNALDIKGPLD
jgi:hypothetical protein